MCSVCVEARKRGAFPREALALARAEALERDMLAEVIAEGPKRGSTVMSQWSHPLTGLRVKTDPQVKCTWMRDPHDDERVEKAHALAVRLRSELRRAMRISC